MKGERFYDFVVGVHHLDKYIKAIESSIALKIGVKGVHIFMIYSLIDSPEGLTASEIARKNGNDRSLVSREIDKLRKEGIVRYSATDEKKYNAKIVLTEKGREIAKSFTDIGMRAQDEARGDNISAKELAVFYVVLKRLTENITELSKTK